MGPLRTNAVHGTAVPRAQLQHAWLSCRRLLGITLLPRLQGDVEHVQHVIECAHALPQSFSPPS